MGNDTKHTHPTWDGTLGGIDTTETDLLIIGSGFAGLWAAITAHDAGVQRITLIDKGDVARSSQSRMSAGATVYLLPDDDLDTWVRDVAEAQRWLCHQDMVEDMLATSYSRLARLEGWGVGYEQMGEFGYLRLPSRGFEHLQMLVLPSYRGRTGGRAVTTALREQVVRRRCRLLPRHFVTDLLGGEDGLCGALAVDRSTGAPHLVRAGAVVLATGDCSFRGHYACVDSATGDGFALALEAGARLANMEFLCVNTGPAQFGFEGTGIATRFGGTFRNAEGEAFMSAYNPSGDSAEVAYLVRAMAMEAEQGRAPFTLDMTAAAGENSFLRIAFASMGGFMPVNLGRLAEEGTDVFSEPVGWEPAIQTLRGGVRTDIDGATDVPGLFAAGMAQAFDPGLFNGWSSMRAMWSGERAGRAAANHLQSAGPAASGAAIGPPVDAGDLEDRVHRGQAPLGIAAQSARKPAEVLDSLQGAVFARDVCLLKRQESMATALEQVRSLLAETGAGIRAESPHELVKAHETRNMLISAELFLAASMARTESRGDHQRADHPELDNDRWLRWVNQRREPSEGAGEPGVLEMETEPVPLQRYRFQPPDDTAHPDVASERSLEAS